MIKRIVYVTEYTTKSHSRTTLISVTGREADAKNIPHHYATLSEPLVWVETYTGWRAQGARGGHFTITEGGVSFDS